MDWKIKPETYFGIRRADDECALTLFYSTSFEAREVALQHGYDVLERYDSDGTRVRLAL